MEEIKAITVLRGCWASGDCLKKGETYSVGKGKDVTSKDARILIDLGKAEPALDVPKRAATASATSSGTKGK